ncbi:MAG: hypothetical protein WDZ30_08075 [Cellvibrionaceae bacterium]
MRGRAQAAMVALLGAFVPFVSPGTVALVSLRRGGFDGFYVGGWAMLPVVVLTFVDPQSLPVAFYYFCVLVVAIGGALVLRSQGIWPVSVIGLVVLSATGGLVFGLSFPGFNEQLIAEVQQIQEETRARLQEQGTELSEPITITTTLIAGFVAALVAFNGVLALVIGRWWQAMLYNPGGFREEFQQFRLGKTQSLLLFGIAAICVSRPNWFFWGMLAALPLFLVCAAIVHNRVYAKGGGLAWLILFYLLSIFQPFFLLAFSIGFTDAWVDYRRRFGPQLNNEQ